MAPVHDVRQTLWGMEYSLHKCPKPHLPEIQHVFPGVGVADMLIISTCQRAGVDLVRVGEEVDNEKDRLLERFMAWAEAVSEAVSRQGYWADYIDPCSGLPMRSRDCQHVYSEVDALATLLGYKLQNTGCCKVVLHPRWGSAIYPASLMAKAPPEVVLDAIRAAEAALDGCQL